MKPLLISIAILLVAAPVAYAAKFVGQTSQDRRAVVVTKDGLPVRFTFVWRGPCDDDSYLTDDTSSVPPYDESTATFVRDRGRYTTQIADERGRKYEFRALARMRATRVTENKWRGRFRISGTLHRNGELITGCDTGRIRFSATR